MRDEEMGSRSTQNGLEQSSHDYGVEVAVGVAEGDVERRCEVECRGGDVEAEVVAAIVFKLHTHGIATAQEAAERNLPGFHLRRVKE